jgi:hypothetical protein
MGDIPFVFFLEFSGNVSRPLDLFRSTLDYVVFRQPRVALYRSYYNCPSVVKIVVV